MTVETVARFKGLEGEVLILWGLDALPSEERRETLYVGISRAKSILALCGSQGILAFATKSLERNQRVPLLALLIMSTRPLF